jgi:DNA modification methylase
MVSFIWNTPRAAYDEGYVNSHYTNLDSTRRRFRYDNLVKPKGSAGYFYSLLDCPPPPNGWRMPQSRAEQWLKEGRIEIPQRGKIPAYKRYLDEMEGTVLGNIWIDIAPINSQAKEALEYPTQKPEALLERIIRASSSEGNLVLDCFCGSGTTAAVAEKLNRRWITCDLGRFAIHTTRKRLLSIDNVKPFVVQNLGKYERQAWQAAEFADPT